MFCGTFQAIIILIILIILTPSDSYPFSDQIIPQELTDSSASPSLPSSASDLLNPAQFAANYGDYTENGNNNNVKQISNNLLTNSGMMSQLENRADLFSSPFERRMFNPFNRLLLTLLGPRLMRFQMDMMMQAVMSEIIRKMIGPIITAVTNRVISPADNQHSKGLISLGLGGNQAANGGHISTPQIQVIPSHTSPGQIQLIIKPSADSSSSTTSLALGQPSNDPVSGQNWAVQVPQTVDSQLQQHLYQQLISQIPAQLLPQVQQQIQSQVEKRIPLLQQQLQNQVKLQLLQQLQQQILGQNGNLNLQANLPNPLMNLPTNQHAINSIANYQSPSSIISSNNNNNNEPQKAINGIKNPSNIESINSLLKNNQQSTGTTSGSSLVPNVQLVGYSPEYQPQSMGQQLTMINPEVKFAMPIVSTNGQEIINYETVSPTSTISDGKILPEVKNYSSSYMTISEEEKRKNQDDITRLKLPQFNENNEQNLVSQNSHSLSANKLSSEVSSSPSRPINDDDNNDNLKNSSQIANYENVKEIIEKTKIEDGEDKLLTIKDDDKNLSSNDESLKINEDKNDHPSNRENEMFSNHQYNNNLEEESSSSSTDSQKATSESRHYHHHQLILGANQAAKLDNDNQKAIQHHQEEAINEYSSGFSEEQEEERKKRWKTVLQNLDKYYGI